MDYKVELLAPAGSREALEGALSAGADAVYLGGERFGARAYADNFSTEEILRAIEDAHLLGRRIYLTANVLTREEELPELARFVKTLYEGGLDGVIVQDTGVLSVLGEECPGLPLHASTQLSVMTSEGVRYLQERYGICRVVPARELSLQEIRALREEAPSMEIEAFIHGAMCYSCSGRCLMSSFLGGRSGNRGRCAGTCRLPYRVLDESGKPAGPDAGKKEVWPISMKDLCVLPILPELIDAGIHSFKIEGRMKKPVYAAGVTAVYRKYIDRFYAWAEAGRPGSWTVEEADLEKLRKLYIRTDLGTGYYYKRNGRELVTIGKPGYAGTDAALEEEIRQKYLTGLPRIAIRGRAVFRIGEPARLEVHAEQRELLPAGTKTAAGTASAFAEGPVVQKASGRPLDPSELSRRLQKTGDSRFTFTDLQIEADEGVFLPVSAVNALRRDALQNLREKLLEFCRRTVFPAAEGLSAADYISAGAGPATGRLGGTPGSDASSKPERDQTARLDLEKLGGAPGSDASSKPEREQMAGPAPERQDPAQELWALVSTREQAEAAVKAGCACIIADGCFDRFDLEEILREGQPDRGCPAPAEPLPEKQLEKGNISPAETLLEKQLEKGNVSPAEPLSEKQLNTGFFEEKTQKGNKYTLKSQKIRWICALPPVFRVSDRERIRDRILETQENGNGWSGILIRTPDELQLALEAGYEGEMIADASLYSWNGRSMAGLLADCDRVVCSLELHQKDLRRASAGALKAGERRISGNPDPAEAVDVQAAEMMEPSDTRETTLPEKAAAIAAKPLVLPVYGRVPMMETAGCVRRTENRCSGVDGFWYLEDRKGMRLPVRCRCEDCSNTVYNAVPLSLHQFAGRGLYAEVPALLCMFTTESAGQTEQILRFFAETRGNRSGNRRRGSSKKSKAPEPPFSAFTNGHYKSGAL